ncbi:hypothetical protein B566_EDAN015054 [Ephemera danica]|nr:hypothetical protein B566_EDAN015054 [Ephemera danica]
MAPLPRSPVCWRTVAEGGESGEVASTLLGDAPTMMCTAGFLVLVLAATSLVCEAQDIVNFCKHYTFVSANSSQSGLHLTREISARDYAIYRKFKSIHCCARGYRSIEW